MTAYVVAFMMNIGNFEPVMIKDCSAIKIENAKSEVLVQVKKMQETGLRCEQIEDKISYACVNEKSGIVGRAIVLKDLKECKAFPGKISRDMKNLLNVRN
jgi:hypothetical protein